MKDRRSEPRVRRLLGVSFLYEGISVKATVTDINRSGAFLHSRVLPKPGTILEIAIKTNTPGAYVVMATGEVVRVVEQSTGPGQIRGFAVRWLSMRSRGGPKALADMLRDMGTGPVPEALPMTPTPTSVEYSFVKRKFVERTPTDPAFRLADDSFEPPEPSKAPEEVRIEAWPVSLPVEVYCRKQRIRGTLRKIGRRYLLVETESSLPISSMVSVRLNLKQPPFACDIYVLGLVVATTPDPSGGGKAEVRISSVAGEHTPQCFERLLTLASEGKLG